MKKRRLDKNIRTQPFKVNRREEEILFCGFKAEESREKSERNNKHC